MYFGWRVDHLNSPFVSTSQTDILSFNHVLPRKSLSQTIENHGLLVSSIRECAFHLQSHSELIAKNTQLLNAQQQNVDIVEQIKSLIRIKNQTIFFLFLALFILNV